MKTNWNYPTTIWVGENRIQDLGLACKNLKINKPLFVTDKDLINLKMVQDIIKDLKKTYNHIQVFSNFSGNPINSAPLLAANSICSSASVKFSSTFEVLVICNAATKKSVKNLLLVNQFVNHEARITPLSTCAGTISKQSSSEQHLKSSS